MKNIKCRLLCSIIVLAMLTLQSIQFIYITDKEDIEASSSGNISEIPSDGSQTSSSGITGTPAATQQVTAAPGATSSSAVTPEATDIPASPTPTMLPTESILMSEEGYFYENDITVELTLDSHKEGLIYYTLDGSMPDENSAIYSEPLHFTASETERVMLYTVKCIAIYSDGSVSDIFAHSYFVGADVNSTFSTLVISISGDAAELTDEPDGILYGDNYVNEGKAYEKEVLIEALNADGTLVFSQFGGVRVFGGESRKYGLKSLKIYARESYSSGEGSFDTDIFGTVSKATGKIIDEYDKLVLRVGGDDYQYAYIRDELAQTLAKDAGFSDYEAAAPATVFLNGQYYGLVWLHESYCDDYFKEKYGGKGEYIVIEGAETWKYGGDSAQEQSARNEYSSIYSKYAYADLTDDTVYKELCKVIDVENYLRYYAFNLYIGNGDWPQGNYKCYRYYAAEGEEYEEGERDGRWRYLLHDMDISMALYDTATTKTYSFNAWEVVTTEGRLQYSPLFTALLERDDCRTYFTEYTLELADGALSAENICARVDELHKLREKELAFFIDKMDELIQNGAETYRMYTAPVIRSINQIKDFSKKRKAYMLKFLSELFEPPI